MYVQQVYTVKRQNIDNTQKKKNLCKKAIHTFFSRKISSIFKNLSSFIQNQKHEKNH